MQNEEDLQIQAAINQLQQAFDYSKRRRNDQAKIWQQRAEELENQLVMMQESFQKLDIEKKRVESELHDSLTQIDNLKAQNSALMQALQEKEEQIKRFMNLNQNLKNLIDQTPYVQQDIQKLQVSSINQDISYKPSYVPSTVSHIDDRSSQQDSISSISQVVPRKSTTSSTKRTASKKYSRL